MRGAVLVRESEKDGQIDSKKEGKDIFTGMKNLQNL